MFPSNGIDANVAEDMFDHHNLKNDESECFGFLGAKTPVHSNKMDATSLEIMTGENNDTTLSGTGTGTGTKDTDTTMLASTDTDTDPETLVGSGSATPTASAPQEDASATKKYQHLLESVNRGLEGSLAEHKNTTKRFFAQLHQFADMAAHTHAQWTPLQEAEHVEAERLATVQGEVHGSVRTFLDGVVRAGDGKA